MMLRHSLNFSLHEPSLYTIGNSEQTCLWQVALHCLFVSTYVHTSSIHCYLSLLSMSNRTLILPDSATMLSKSSDDSHAGYLVARYMYMPHMVK